MGEEEVLEWWQSESWVSEEKFCYWVLEVLNQPRGNIIPRLPLMTAVTSKLSLHQPASSGPAITCWPRGNVEAQSLGLSSCLSCLECVLHLALDHSDKSSQLDLRPSLLLWPCLDIAGLWLTMAIATGPALITLFGSQFTFPPGAAQSCHSWTALSLMQQCSTS